jgi:hypothetical protein
MPRFLDLECSACGAEVDDIFFMRVPERIVHLEDGGTFEQVYRLRPSNAQWSDRDSVVVFKDAQGHVKFPLRNDAPVPPGCERIVMRSLREVERFERDHNVRSHIAHYDSGSGHSADDAAPPSNLPSERERYERFRESTRGIF